MTLHGYTNWSANTDTYSLPRSDVQSLSRHTDGAFDPQLFILSPVDQIRAD